MLDAKVDSLTSIQEKLQKKSSVMWKRREQVMGTVKGYGLTDV